MRFPKTSPANAGPRLPLAAILALSLAGLAAQPAASADPTPLPVDAETTVNGVDVACTGIGQMRDDPRWAAYGVRVEFSNALNEYLGSGAVMVTARSGKEIVSLSCDAPWILMRLPPGAYRLDGWLPGSTAKPRSAPFSPPAKGQMRLVLQFPDA